MEEVKWSNWCAKTINFSCWCRVDAATVNIFTVGDRGERAANSDQTITVQAHTCHVIKETPITWLGRSQRDFHAVYTILRVFKPVILLQGESSSLRALVRGRRPAGDWSASQSLWLVGNLTWSPLWRCLTRHGGITLNINLLLYYMGDWSSAERLTAHMSRWRWLTSDGFTPPWRDIFGGRKSFEVWLRRENHKKSYILEDISRRISRRISLMRWYSKLIVSKYYITITNKCYESKKFTWKIVSPTLIVGGQCCSALSFWKYQCLPN